MENLREKAKSTVTSPGVYLMKDKNSRVIYVGKAKNLKNRLKTYFQQGSDKSPKTQVMVSRVQNFDIIITDTEAEALILECNLIKKHRPKYNIRLRDDKNFPYLKLDMNRVVPLLTYSRKVERDGSKYFGPFVSGSARAMVRFVNKVFQLRDCSDSELKNRSRPCLNYDMGICTAPCVSEEKGGVHWDQYQEQVDRASLFLSGKSDECIKEMKVEMDGAAENLEYEKAKIIRDQILEIEKFQQSQKIIDANQDHDWDVVGFARKDELAQFCLLIVRGGKLVSKRNWHFPDIQGSDEEIISQFVAQYYEENFVPWVVMLPKKTKDEKELVDYLAFRSKEQGHQKRKPKIEFPQKGHKNEFVEMANQNAVNALDDLLGAKENKLSILAKMKEKLKLENFPTRIECFDNSNFQGDDPVASRVCFIDGKPAKDYYRRYHIRTVQGPDDFASMREILIRRFNHKKDHEEDPYPDLLLVDGGPGQLSMAVAVFKELRIEGVDLAGIAKAKTKSDMQSKEVERTQERIYKPGRKNPIVLRDGDPITNLVTQVRDESHRFAITFHRKKRDSNKLKSELDLIAGLGPKKKKALLEVFGNIESIKSAPVDELEKVDGIDEKLAKLIFETFDPYSSI